MKRLTEIDYKVARLEKLISQWEKELDADEDCNDGSLEWVDSHRELIRLIDNAYYERARLIAEAERGVDY